MGPDPEKPPPGDDPFERLVLNEEFVKSASINESAVARQEPARISRRRRLKARLHRIGRRGGRQGQPRDRPYRPVAPVRPAARRPSSTRLPDWTPQQWVVTLIAALGVAAYLYFSLGGHA